MRRRTIRIALLLLAGAAMNVAVAWGGMVTTVSRGQVTARPATPGERWWVSVPTDWPATPRTVLEPDASADLVLQQMRSVASRLLFRASHASQRAWDPHTGAGASRSFHLSRLRCGSPMLSLQMRVGWVDSGVAARPIRLRQFDGAFHTPGFGRYIPPLVLPVRPVWPGFAVNTLCYAALLGIVLAIPGMVRTAVRRRRGQCIHCGYPIGVSEVCTECGKIVEPAT